MMLSAFDSLMVTKEKEKEIEKQCKKCFLW